MNITETKDLVAKIFAVDGREMSDQAIASWHGAVGHLNREIAGVAAKACLQEQTGRVMPAHIIAKAKDQAREKSAKLMDEEKTGKKFGDASPICDHGRSLLTCMPCGKALAESHKCRHNLYPIYCSQCQPKFQMMNIVDWVARKQIV
jgi:hypothetical protein